MRGLMLILCIFLVACIPPQVPTQEVPAQEEVESTKIVVDNELVDLAVPTSCVDEDGEDSKVRGEAVVYYSDGAKETLDDKCERESGLQIEYYCDGITAKTRINRCTNTCVKGACT